MNFEYRWLDIVGLAGLLGGGAFLLYDAIPQRVGPGVWEVLAGSTLLSLGLVLLYTESLWFLRWRRALKIQAEQRPRQNE